ncbi:MAG: metallophosphoesterase family protein [Woeseiaceae bacterium]|nr:metallophosphoesterase family protein [Woeseiaceae bacterium]
MNRLASTLSVAAIVGLALGQAGCADPADIPRGIFVSNVTDAATPWNHDDFDADDDKFTFAVFSDLTGGERDRVFDVAMAQLNLLRPELIVNVGDLIEGDSETEEGLHAEWDTFDDRAMAARAPIFYMGGNHDLTGEMLRDVWRERHGRTYYQFIYKDVLFLVLDTEDNTAERIAYMQKVRNEAIEVAETEGWDAFEETEYANLPERSYGNITAEQADHFLRVLEAEDDVRWTFLLMHKPAWEREGEEQFARIEAALADRPYTVFHGHVHAYGYQQRNGRDYIRLATTGGSQIPERGRSMDHVTLVTVDDDGVDIANLLLSGILDKTGKIPLNGDEICFEVAVCGDPE